MRTCFHRKLFAFLCGQVCLFALYTVQILYLKTYVNNKIFIFNQYEPIKV